jgi:thiazole synthase
MSATVPMTSDNGLMLYGRLLASRFLLGTAQYASPSIMADAIRASGAGVVTVAIRREMARGGSGAGFLASIAGLGVQLLPNTAGCHSVKEAVTTAQMARELYGTTWIKIEVIGNDDTLHPDVFALVEAARILTEDGFQVFPYTTEDLGVAERLLRAGCAVLMPWGAPIGTGRGLINPYALTSLRRYFPDVPLIIDAGIGAPSHAAQAMELGFDGVLLNTAVSKAADPVRMASAVALAIDAGRIGYLAGLMEMRDMAEPSTPVAGTPSFDRKP